MISYKGKEYVEYDNAIALLEEKDKEIERLNNIIDKAIEYINNKEFVNYKKGLGNLERMLKHRQDLLAILKGVDKE